MRVRGCGKKQTWLLDWFDVHHPLAYQEPFGDTANMFKFIISNKFTTSLQINQGNSCMPRLLKVYI